MDASAESVVIRLNGEEREVPASRSVADLVRDLGRDPLSVAVELDGEILPRQRFGETRVRRGSRIEVVQFVQGG